MGTTLEATRVDILKIFKPRTGIRIGRQPFFKARCIKHCVDMAHNRSMCVEKKYDGEYLQLHIDMSKCGDQRIKILSKSGKDSTRDRVGIHGYVYL
jgi:DNA ligase 4